jgi:mannose-1-phosphate guanylyltransferase
MILAAGLGTRMRPLTERVAKPALPVLNRPLIQWTLELLARHGVDEVVINLHHLPRTIRAAAGDGAAFRMKIRYSRERTILGTAGGPRRVRRWLGNDPFLLVNGDVLLDLDLTRLVNWHVAHGALATLALRPNPDPRRYPAVRTNAQGRVVCLPGAQRRRRGQAWLFAGVHVMEPGLLDRLPDGPSDSVRDLYAPLVDADEPIIGRRMRGTWLDMGTPELYRSGQLAALTHGFGGLGRRTTLVSRSARVHATAHVTRSVVGAQAVIERDAHVQGSVVWAGARIGVGARVRDAVVAAGAQVPAGGEVRGGVVMGAAAGRRIQS